MLKVIKRWLIRILVAGVVLAVLSIGWLVIYATSDLPVTPPVQFSLKHGSSLRSSARQLQAAGIINSPGQFELLARLKGDALNVQAGNYEITGNISPYLLLRLITSGPHGQDQITVVEGWTFRQLRDALDAHAAIKHDTRGLAESEIADRLGTKSPSLEGWFFPETYYFTNGSSDVSILRRGYRMMQSQLEDRWKARASGLPLATPYEALILASIVEKETGQASERPMIAAVFINRLRNGMKLQTDPTVIYGLGENFDGNLRKRDLLTDTAYNTYTRTGLPPTPISLPGVASLTAALNPAPTNALYFVSRGDGTSHFSGSLTEHERAVTRYQRRGNR
jgi:UPF0755 protein